MNNLIIIGILLMVIGNGLGLYLIHLGRTEVNKSSTQDIKEKIEEKAKESENRDSITHELIKSSKEEIIQHYQNSFAGTNAEINLINEKVDELLKSNKYQTSNSDIIRKSYDYFINKEIDKANSLLTEEFLQSNQDELELAFQLKGDLAFINGDIPVGIEYYNKIISINPIKKNLRQLCDVYYKLNQLNDADKICDREIEYAKNNIESYSVDDLANLYNKCFVIKQRLGSEKEAFTLLGQGLNLLNQKESKSNVDIETIASLKANYGTYLSKGANVNEGEKILKEVDESIKEILDKNNDKHLLILGNTNLNLSNIESDKGNYSSAWKYLDKAEEIFQFKGVEYAVNNFYDDLIRITNNKATLNVEAEQFEEAIKCYQKTIEMSKAGKKGNLPRKYEELEAQGYLSLGMAYIKLNDKTNGILNYKESLNRFTELAKQEPDRFRGKIEFVKSEIKKYER